MYASSLYVVINRKNGSVTHVVESGLITIDKLLDADNIKKALRNLDYGEMVNIHNYTIISGKDGISIEELQKREKYVKYC